MLIAGVPRRRTVEACSCFSSDLSVPCELYATRAGGVRRTRHRRLAARRRRDGPFPGPSRVERRRGWRGQRPERRLRRRVRVPVRAGAGVPRVYRPATRTAAIAIDGVLATPSGRLTSNAFNRDSRAFVAVARPASGGRIFYGDVDLLPPPRIPTRAKKPVDGAAVILRGGGQERRTTTVKGRYEFTGLPPGVYERQRLQPARFAARPRARAFRSTTSAVQRFRPYEPEPSRRVTITPDRSCGYAPFEAVPKARSERRLSRSAGCRSAGRRDRRIAAWLPRGGRRRACRRALDRPHRGRWRLPAPRDRPDDVQELAAIRLY